MKLIEMPIDQARAVKWREGRKRYGGPAFVGDPLEELDGELLDGMNYAEEAARRGYDMAGISEALRDLCERTRALYCAGKGAAK